MDIFVVWLPSQPLSFISTAGRSSVSTYQSVDKLGSRPASQHHLHNDIYFLFHPGLQVQVHGDDKQPTQIAAISVAHHKSLTQLWLLRQKVTHSYTGFPWDERIQILAKFDGNLEWYWVVQIYEAKSTPPPLPCLRNRFGWDPSINAMHANTDSWWIQIYSSARTKLAFWFRTKAVTHSINP